MSEMMFYSSINPGSDMEERERERERAVNIAAVELFEDCKQNLVSNWIRQFVQVA